MYLKTPHSENTFLDNEHMQVEIKGKQVFLQVERKPKILIPYVRLSHRFPGQVTKLICCRSRSRTQISPRLLILVSLVFLLLYNMPTWMLITHLYFKFSQGCLPSKMFYAFLLIEEAMKEMLLKYWFLTTPLITGVLLQKFQSESIATVWP